MKLYYYPYEKGLWEHYDMSISGELRNKYLMYYSDSLEETFIEMHKKSFSVTQDLHMNKEKVATRKKVAEYLYSM